MALNSLICADVPLSNYKLTHCTLSRGYFFTGHSVYVMIKKVGVLESGLVWIFCRPSSWSQD